MGLAAGEELGRGGRTGPLLGASDQVFLDALAEEVLQPRPSGTCPRKGQVLPERDIQDEPTPAPPPPTRRSIASDISSNVTPNLFAIDAANDVSATPPTNW